jgi:pimeloyl-ACP methyl ester carboxylesterase
LKRLLGGALLAAGAIAIYFALTLPIFRTPEAGADQVVLLHGLGRTEAAMLLLENELAGAGFDVHNIGYPSWDESPDELIERVSEEIDDCCLDNGRRLNFVGHSLGGLLIRAYLQDTTPDNLARVVLLGTPNRGSELADQSEGLAGNVLAIAGPTAQMLGTGPDGFAASLEPPDYPVGVIAGTRDSGVTNQWLPLPNDGMVSLESARLSGMTDFLELAVTHWGLRNDAEAARQTIHFLEHGSFSH